MMVVYLLKLDSSSHKDALKLFLLFYFRYFVMISPLKKVWPFIWTNLNPLHPRMQECFVPSLLEIGPVVLEKKILFFNCHFLGGWLILVFCCSIITYISLWKGHEQTWITFTQGWVMPNSFESGPVVVDKTLFSILSMYFRYFIEETWISFTQGCFQPILFELDPMFLKKINKFYQCVFAISLFFPFGKSINPWVKQVPFTQECFVPSFVEIDSVILEILKNCQCSFAIISPWQRTWYFIWTN